MKNRIYTTILLINLSLNFTYAQESESFFPTQVGNIWQYSGAVSLWQNWSILKDSIADDGYRYLYIGYDPGHEEWEYRLDNTFNIYSGAGYWDDTLYHLDSDSGDVWVRYNFAFPKYSWVYDVEEALVFGKETTIKVIRSGPIHPDSGGNDFYDTEQYLASGFGVIYHLEEPTPFDPLFLVGCVIDGDTFGIVTTSLENIKSDLPESFVLKQNYPNPFNPITTIEFSVPKLAEINISIYDLLGRQVAVLFNGWHDAGTYKYKWNANDLASGVYFAKVIVNGNTKTIKILMTK